MGKIKFMIQNIIEMINQRLTDIELICLKQSQQNIITTVYQISSKQNIRLRHIIKYQMNINQIIREQNNQNIEDIGKYLKTVSVNIFTKISQNFKHDKPFKDDFYDLITLYRKYFIQDNDIRMVTKIEELFQNKSIKKPVILIKLLKILIDITRVHLLKNINNVNQKNITQNDIQEQNDQKIAVLKEIFPVNMTNSFENIIRKNTLNIVRPIFMIQSGTKFHQQILKPDIIDKRLDNLLNRRNKLRQKWQQKIRNRTQKQKLSKPATTNTSPAQIKIYSSKTPISETKQSSDCQSNNKSTILYLQLKKPKTTQIIKREKQIKQKLTDKLKTPIGKRKQQKFRDFSGISIFKSIYGILGLDQKTNNKMFLKKSRRYFLELQLKQSIGRNKDISRQIGVFNCQV